MQTVLVIGGAGFIGHHLVRRLAAENHRVIVFDNLSNSNKDFLKELEINRNNGDRILLNKKDIRNREEVYNIFKTENIDICIHLAAKVSVQDSIIDPKETMDVNVYGTLNVLQACCDSNVDNFVFASSSAVYGHANELPIPENHLTRPISPYGASKVAGEALVSAFSSRLRRSRILRFFNVYGHGQTQTYAGVITRFRERLLSGHPPIVYGNGSQTRDFIHVDDIVRAIILAAGIGRNKDNRKDNHITLNIGTGKPITILDLCQMMIGIFGRRNAGPIFADPAEGDITHSYANIQRANEILNFSPKEDLSSGLRKI
jgi:UDP-glucose 4-epimerase